MGVEQREYTYLHMWKMAKQGNAKVNASFKYRDYQSAGADSAWRKFPVTWELATVSGILSCALFPIPSCFYFSSPFFHTIIGQDVIAALSEEFTAQKMWFVVAIHQTKKGQGR